MSTESGTSSTEQIQRAFDDAASFFQDDDAGKARRLITAGVILLRRHATFAGKGGVTMSFNPDMVRSQIGFAKEYLAARLPVDEGGAGIVYHSIENYR